MSLIIKKLLKYFRMFFYYPYDLVKCRNWKPYSKIILKNENSSWVLDEIFHELNFFLRSLDFELVDERYIYNSKNQILFNLSKYDVLKNIHKYNHKIFFPYFHGQPDSNDEFQLLVNMIKKYHDKISGIQVSNSLTEKTILETGIDKKKVFRIPISIDLEKFNNIKNTRAPLTRRSLGIPDDAFVIGSFQKDGTGWKEGNQPKLIKGPDILVKSLINIQKKIKNIYVLLLGPARGYIKGQLKKSSIPFKHKILSDHQNIQKYYNLLDVYMITSREEGGPRALFEAMISKIPVVTTNVGMAIDLFEHKFHGWKVDVDDVDSLSYWVEYIFNNKKNLNEILANAYDLAKNNSYQFQRKLWLNFLKNG
jgi:glycosyltransferase involved in cell wall biosynthesis